MFQLHDRTRRNITRALFLVLCVAPTVAVVAWCLVLRAPSHARCVEQQLGWQLGLRVTLSAVCYPRPGVARYQGLALWDPETGRRLLGCAAIEVAGGPWAERPAPSPSDAAQTDSKRAPVPSPSADVLRISAKGSLELEAGGIEELRRLAERVLCRRAGALPAQVQLSAGEVVILADGKRTTLRDLVGTLATVPLEDSAARGAQETALELAFHPEARSSGLPATIRINRPHTSSSGTEPRPATQIALCTGDAPLPASLLARFSELFTLAGPDARFRGTIRGVQQPEGTSYEFENCQLVDCDLSRLLADRFPPHRLTGMAQFDLHACQWTAGRIERLHGTLRAPRGAVSPSLVQATARCLGLRSGLWQKEAELVAFDELAVEFLLSPQGLQLRGLVGDGEIILRDRVDDLLTGACYEPLSLASLLAVLAPNEPVGPNAALGRLARCLPAPLLAPATFSTDTRAEVRQSSHTTSEPLR